MNPSFSPKTCPFEFSSGSEIIILLIRITNSPFLCPAEYSAYTVWPTCWLAIPSPLVYRTKSFRVNVQLRLNLNTRVTTSKLIQALKIMFPVIVNTYSRWHPQLSGEYINHLIRSYKSLYLIKRLKIPHEYRWIIQQTCSCPNNHQSVVQTLPRT
jgi:hypothetical protein